MENFLQAIKKLRNDKVLATIHPKKESKAVKEEIEILSDRVRNARYNK